VEILWKAGHQQSFCWLSGFPAPGLCLWPLVLARGVPDCCWLVTAALRQRGIVSDWRFMGKRKVYEGHSALAHRIHSFSTSTEFVQHIAILPLRLLFSL